MSTYLRVLRFALKYRARFLVAWLCVLGASAFMLVGPQVVKYAITNGINKDSQQRYLILIVAGLSMFAAAALRSVSQYGRQYLGQYLGQRVAYDLRNSIYDRLQHL